MARTGMTNTDLSEMCFKITVTQRYMASKHDITKHTKKNTKVNLFPDKLFSV